MKEDWRRYVGKRILIGINLFSQKIVKEVRVKEVSPSGKYVCLELPNGNKTWREISDYEIVEVLEGD